MDVSFAVHSLVKAILQMLFNQIEQQTRRPDYHPKMILKIILYTYTQRFFSGQKIEFLLDDSHRTRWSANHEQIIHRAINRFRRNETMAQLLSETFVLFRRHLIANQVIDNGALFIDPDPTGTNGLPAKKPKL